MRRSRPTLSRPAQLWSHNTRMPSRVDDYDVLYTIGSGSYGRCQKVRRKSDGKVSTVFRFGTAHLFSSSGWPLVAVFVSSKTLWGCKLWISYNVTRSITKQNVCDVGLFSGGFGVKLVHLSPDTRVMRIVLETKACWVFFFLLRRLRRLLIILMLAMIVNGGFNQNKVWTTTWRVFESAERIQPESVLCY